MRSGVFVHGRLLPAVPEGVRASAQHGQTQRLREGRPGKPADASECPSDRGPEAATPVCALGDYQWGKSEYISGDPADLLKKMHQWKIEIERYLHRIRDTGSYKPH